MEARAITIQVNRHSALKKLLYCCLSAELFIVLADIFLNYFEWIPFRPLRRTFNITREDAIGNWFSSTQTLCVGIVLWTLFALDRNDKKKWGWAVLASFFTFMAFDDASKFHERAGSSFKALAPSLAWVEALVEQCPSYTWQILVGPFFAVMGLCIVWFIWKELDTPRYRLWLGAALACLVVAVGLDAIEGMDLPSLSSYPVRHFLKLVEELLEMLGNTLFLLTFSSVLLHHTQEVAIDLT